MVQKCLYLVLAVMLLCAPALAYCTPYAPRHLQHSHALPPVLLLAAAAAAHQPCRCILQSVSFIDGTHRVQRQSIGCWEMQESDIGRCQAESVARGDLGACSKVLA
jgi:hypothetical protein